MKSKSMLWTSKFSHGSCPCRSGEPAYSCCYKGNGHWERAPVGTIEPAKTDFKNDRCYLSPTGNCGVKITREHFISRQILEQITTSTLKFEGTSPIFGGKQSVEIGINSFSAKVLCDRHNSALSPLDDAAGLAFSAIEALSLDLKRIAETQETLKSLYVASGIDIERWMVKVYCGLVAAGQIRGASGSIVHLGTLQPSLLNSLMGTSPLETPLGLYMHSFAGQTRTAGGFTFATIQLTNGSGEVGGLILALGLMNLVLVTSPTYGQTFTDPNWYRHPSLLFDVRQSGSRVAYLFTY